jgi:bifunctional non-homologous end joining protein LigD
MTITRPESVLTGRTNQDLESGKKDKANSNKNKIAVIESKTKTYLLVTTTKKDKSAIVSKEVNIKENGLSVDEEFPTKIGPMLATAVDEPFDDKDWVFEVKWEGVRSVFFLHKTKRIFEIKSRSDKTITQRYPELVGPLNSAINCQDSVILDGEIVVLDKDGMPCFQNHQRRMNIDYRADIEKFSREIPATYYIFDILY